MKRIIIPIKNNKLSEDFSKCSHFLLIEIYKEHIAEKKIEISNKENKYIVTNWLITNKISDIIAHRMDNEIIDSLMNTKLNIFVGIAIDNPEVLIENYLSGKLKSNTKLINTKAKALTNNI